MGLIEQQLSQDVSEALAYLMNTRLKMNFWHSSTTKSLPQTTLIPKIYPHLRRDLLKDALQVVRQFKHHVSSQFNLHYA